MLALADYVEGIRRRDTAVLARAITLVESNAPSHQELAQQLLAQLLPKTGGAMRVGITGIPGVGKSTFIEALGSRLCEKGRRVAVLAVDPSSTLTGGSILADKIRMKNSPDKRGHLSARRHREVRSVAWRAKVARRCFCVRQPDTMS